MVRDTGSLLLSLVLDMENPTESRNKSLVMELTVSDKPRESDSETNGVVTEFVWWGEKEKFSWVDMLEATWLVTSESFSEEASTSRSKAGGFMIQIWKTT